VTTLCIPTTTHRTAFVDWQTGQGTQIMAAVTAKRQCGLTEVGNFDMYNVDAKFSSSSDHVRIWRDTTNWYIGGGGNAYGGGRCVDVEETPTDLGNANWEWIAPSSGTSTHDLAPGNNGGANGLQCFLTGLGGNFRNSDYTDGVFVNYDSDDVKWTMSTSNGKTGWAACIE